MKKRNLPFPGKKQGVRHRTGRLLRGLAVLMTAAAAASGMPRAVSADYQDHYYMGSRNIGSSRTMTGNIKIIVVFVNDSTSFWTQDAKDALFRGIYTDAAYFEERAGAWGARLHFDYGYFDVEVPYGNEDDWYNYLMRSFFYNPDCSMETLQEYYESQDGYDDTPILFAFNREGRSYSYMADGLNGLQSEYSVYFVQSMGSEQSIAHEFLHLYGAHDYYFPQLAADAGGRYFPESSMMVGSREVDDLTAYLIGWTDTLTWDAMSFLDETMALDQKMVDEGLQETLKNWNYG